MGYNPKSYRKFLAATVSAAVVSTSAAVVAPVNTEAATQDNFSDVLPGKSYYDAVKFLKDHNISEGFGDDTYRPSQSLTRAEAAKMLALALQLDTETVVDPGFSDVNEAWYFKYVAALANEGIVGGFDDNTYRPYQTVTRSEMAKMITNAYNLEAETDSKVFTDVNYDKWYGSYISALFDNKVTTGKTATTFSPYENVNRGEMALFIYRSAQLELTSVSYEFGAGFDSFIAGVENTFSVKATALNVDQDKNVRYKATLELEGIPIGDQEIHYEIDTDVWGTFTTDADGVAYFGPESGFKTEDIDLQNGVTTNFKSVLDFSGEYTLKIELVDVDTDAVIGEAGEVDFIAGQPVQFTFSGLGENVELETGVEIDFSVAVSLHELYSTENKNLRYIAVVGNIGGDDFIPYEGLVINYNEVEQGEVDFESSFTTDVDGLAYFGPATGLSELAVSALKSGTPIETDFKVTIEDTGVYGLLLMLVDVDTDGVTVLDNGLIGLEAVTFEVK